MKNPYNSRNAPPKAGAMLEALRGLGYSTATALADIIDNSIAANASKVDILFKWNGKQSVISVLDDGSGMNDCELDLAMRLGERNPIIERQSHDLGRFGLGLKTASFSQCRRLTVASRKAGNLNCLRWDLDVLAACEDDGWHLLEGPDENSMGFLAPLYATQDAGTIVLWEIPDRIITPGFCEQDFLDLIDRVERHLAMVFHRFISGSRLQISINGKRVEPWDPFLTRHPATWSSPTERILKEYGAVEVRCHVLPHKDRMETRDHDSAAGPDGWTAQQGFYVYRNERLLVSGSWLGLGRGRSWTKEEAHRLARIRLDIPNTADAEWKIDVRKSSARPPVSIRERLTRLAEDTRDRARRVFAHRGQPLRTGNNEPLAQAWRTEHFKGGIRYRIDPEHPVIKSVLEDAGAIEPQIRAMLRIIEETIPVQRIWLDTTEARETPRTGFAGDPSAVETVLSVVYGSMVLRKGIPPAQAKALLLNMNPFNNYPDLISKLPDKPDAHDKE
jgi:hypothetical protein